MSNRKFVIQRTVTTVEQITIDLDTAIRLFGEDVDFTDTDISHAGSMEDTLHADEFHPAIVELAPKMREETQEATDIRVWEE